MLEMIKTYAWEYRYIIIVLLCGIIYLIVDRERAIAQLYNLMLQAKRKAKDGILKSGQAQEDWVVTKAMCFLPKWWVVFVGKNRTRKIVKKLFQLGKDYFDDGVINNSTGENTESMADTITGIIMDTPEPVQQMPTSVSTLPPISIPDVPESEQPIQIQSPVEVIPEMAPVEAPSQIPEATSPEFTPSTPTTEGDA